jgi:hypothetical protein
MTQIHFKRRSGNEKTGPIPVTTTTAKTCSSLCAFLKNGCYAANFRLGMHWQKVTTETAGGTWEAGMAKIAKLKPGTLWRHNQAGDLPGIDSHIDESELASLVAANRGKRGFTYTHKPVLGDSSLARANRAMIADANANGFTINLSANNLAHADKLAALAIGPVAVVLPADQTRATKTPEGRHVAVCPATISDKVTCATCGLCAVKDRKAIVGFPAHGAAKKKASAVASA